MINGVTAVSNWQYPRNDYLIAGGVRSEHKCSLCPEIVPEPETGGRDSR